MLQLRKVHGRDDRHGMADMIDCRFLKSVLISRTVKYSSVMIIYGGRKSLTAVRWRLMAVRRSLPAESVSRELQSRIGIKLSKEEL